MRWGSPYRRQTRAVGCRHPAVGCSYNRRARTARCAPGVGEARRRAGHNLECREVAGSAGAASAVTSERNVRSGWRFIERWSGDNLVAGYV